MKRWKILAEQTWTEHLAALARLRAELDLERKAGDRARMHARVLDERLQELYARLDHYARYVERLARELDELRQQP